MRYYGALRKEIPLTFWAMMAGTLAITGVGMHRRVRLRRLLFEGRDPRERVRQRHGPWQHRLLARRVRRAADQLLFVAADVPDLLRQAALGGAASISSTRSTATTTIARRGADRRQRRTITAMPHGRRHRRLSPARKPVDDAGAARPAVARRGVRRASCSTTRSSRRGRRGSGTAASSFDEHLIHAMHEVPLWVKLIAVRRDAGRAAIAYRTTSARPDAPARVRRAVRPACTASCSTSGISTSSTTSCSCARRSGSAGCSGSAATSGIIDRFGPHGAARAGRRWATASPRGCSRAISTSYALVMLLGLVGRSAGRSGERR